METDRGLCEVVKDGCSKLTNTFLGVFARLMLIGGNALAAWRTATETDDKLHWWWLVGCIVLMGVDYSIVVLKQKGFDWKWLSPCILIYLGSTLPLVWQLQLKQRDNYINQLKTISDTYSSVHGPQSVVDNSATRSSLTTQATEQFQDDSWRTILTVSNDTWVIIVNESLMYLIILSNWLLPRSNMDRKVLADMLLEFLAIASDNMELLALFDEGKVRENLMLNYWLLIAWFVGFVRFIPMLKHEERNQESCLKTARGEILETLMIIVVQDGSFLVLRLYIMIRLNFVTYSLIFFVMKNLLSLLILFYKIIILLRNLPCCC